MSKPKPFKVTGPKPTVESVCRAFDITLEDTIFFLKKRIKELEDHRNDEYERRLEWRGLDKASVCKSCSGAGVRAYGSTATWHGGMGGQAITNDICDKCWGSGNKDKPWVNLRNLTRKA